MHKENGLVFGKHTKSSQLLWKMFKYKYPEISNKYNYLNLDASNPDPQKKKRYKKLQTEIQSVMCAIS